jgi:Tol biopolymer transport system component
MNIARTIAGALLMLSVLASPALTAPAGAADGLTERVSVSSAGKQGNGISGRSTAPALSDDGNVVAFDSEASDLVPVDANGAVDDVFVHNRLTNETTLASVATDGTQGNDDSQSPALDRTGRLVAFDSDAINLVAEDTNNVRDVFLHDNITGETTRISVNPNGKQGNGSSSSPDITPDGRFVAFTSNANNLVEGDSNHTTDVFVADRLLGTVELVSKNDNGRPGNSFSGPPSISDDGRFVAFSSFASNFVHDDTNGMVDVFVRDRSRGTIERVNVSSTEEEGTSLAAGASIDGTGRYVAFFSDAPNLVPNDTNETYDIFVRDRAAGTTERVSVSSTGEEANAQSSFSIHGSSSAPVISADGQFVAFDSFATNLVADDTNDAIDVFRHDRRTGETVRVSVSSAGAQADDSSSDAAISADGIDVAFLSQASNLVPRDTNRCGFFSDGHCPDVFVHRERR